MKKGLKVLVKLFKTILKAFKRLLNAIINYNQKACLKFFKKFSFTKPSFIKDNTRHYLRFQNKGR